MLIIPPAAARKLANTPESMAMLSAAIGAASVVFGLGLSWFADTPAGPSIVLSAVIAFILVFLFIRK